MQTTNQAEPTVTDTTATRPNGNTHRAETTHHKICSAVIAYLDEVGHHGTSINQVQTLAGV